MPHALLTDLSQTDYARYSKEVISFWNHLRLTGATRDAIKPPKIIVLGPPGSGTSSVAEAVSGLHLPHYETPCKPIPVRIHLSSSPPTEPWSCWITLQSAAYAQQIPFGTTITNEADVDLGIRRAQLAVLRPETPMSQITTMSAEELNESTTATDVAQGTAGGVVCVYVTGPEVVDVTIVDLPCDAHTIKPHSEGENSVFIVLSMDEALEDRDVFNPGGAHEMIGVFTKADSLRGKSLEAHGYWMDRLMNNNSCPSNHKYFAVRLPTDEERTAGISSAEARVLEASYFATNEPWIGSESGNELNERLGMPQLLRGLSSMLIQHFKAGFPGLIGMLSKSLEDDRKELAQLPPQITVSPTTHLVTLVTRFCDGVRARIESDMGPVEGAQEGRIAYRQFKADIWDSRPRFRSRALREGEVKESGAGQAEPDDQSEDEDDGDEDVDPSLPPPSSGTSSISMDLDDIRRCTTRSFEAKVALVVTSQQTWEESVVRCLEKTRDHVMHILFDLIERCFSPHAVLKPHIKVYVAELVNKHYVACMPFLAAALEVEQVPFTQNLQYLSKTTERWFASYKNAWAKSRPVIQAPAPPVPAATYPAPAPFITTSPSWPSVPQSLSTTPFPSNNLSSSTTPSSIKPFWESATPAPQRVVSASPPPPPPPVATSPRKGKKRGRPPQPPQLPLEVSTATPHPAWNSRPSAEERNAFFANRAAPDPASPPGAVPSSTTATEFRPVFAPIPTSNSYSGITPSAFAQPVVSPQNEPRVQRALQALAELGYADLTAEDLKKKLEPVDEYEEEMRVMAEVRGYFHVAYKRVIDNIPLLIDLKFVKAIGKEIQPHLMERLEVGTEAGMQACAECLVEDVEVEAQRSKVIARIAQLENAALDVYRFT